jgi:hypothetical protein
MIIDEAAFIRVTWDVRDEPLAASAVVGSGRVALQLGRRLLELGEESLARLKGVAGSGLLILTGDQESLPWVDGVLYLGRDPAAPSLLVPTTLKPAIPIALLERVLAKRFAHKSPLAVLPDLRLVAPLELARGLARESLRVWLSAQGEG